MAASAATAGVEVFLEACYEARAYYWRNRDCRGSSTPDPYTRLMRILLVCAGIEGFDNSHEDAVTGDVEGPGFTEGRLPGQDIVFAALRHDRLCPKHARQ